MKRRTDILVPLFERVFKTNKTFTKRTIMLKLQKLAPELDVTDDEIRNTINILMQRGTIERDYDKKKGDSKGAVYKVVDKRIIETLKQADQLVEKIRDLARDTIKKKGTEAIPALQEALGELIYKYKLCDTYLNI